MSETWLTETRASYDVDAQGYTDKVRGLLNDQPFLRGNLALFADLVRRAGDGSVVDVGCGPGYVTSHLHDLGLEAFGVDLSPEMAAIARRDYPGLRFEVGNMTGLDLAANSVAGAVAFWSVVHVPDDAVPAVFTEFHRILRPGGPLLVGFHVGDDVQHSATGYTGRPVALDTYLRPCSKVEDWLRSAGFTIEATSILRPDDDAPGAIVHATRR